YVNCATLTAESFAPELFGHKRGAIQGVATSRRGLLRETGDGMIYFDRVDLLSEDLQGSLSRLLDIGSFRPLGSSREVDLTSRLAFSAPSDVPSESGVPASLYHKIAQIGIPIQPLRERTEDIETLAHEFLIAVACERKQRLSFAAGSVAFLMRQELQGNMHELRAMITRASLQARQDGVITPEHLGAKVNGRSAVASASDLKAYVESYEANLIRRALSDAENNRAQAAKNLGIPKRTLADKCLRYGL
ncbi:sigma 54-interacting transcriptional regulator, partial [Halocynthiibacter sp.]|uniref:sigma 54-interacting transcriptional regulator n=1 Tax=Halocynthiibacter sp. TaxID=1979210 RepID=UPI003C55CF70